MMMKEIVFDAYYFAKNAHEGVYRKNSNLPYFVHPKMVARIVDAYGGDDRMIAAALLHDTIEDTDVSYDQILERFGSNVANLVFELTNTDLRDDKSLYANREEYMIDKMVHMTNDALIIKLADRLNNVAYLDYDANTPEAIIFADYYREKTLRIIDGFLRRRKVKTPTHMRLVRSICEELDRVGMFLQKIEGSTDELL